MAITNEFIAKIEGHGSLSINWQNNKVKLNVHEGERLFEGILVGRTAEEAFWITPRICGVCPIAHNLASVGAVEAAKGVSVGETARLLRELMICAQMIQSHVLHLFFLVLPDYIGIDRGTELNKKDPKSFAKALALKELGDEISYVVAGRNVHPTTTTIGGFHKVPTKEELIKLLEKIKNTREQALWTAEFFSGLKYPNLKVDLELVSKKGDKIVSSKGASFSVKEYKTYLEEELRDYSTAKFAKLQGNEMFVGSLARLTLGYLDNLEIGSPSGDLVSKLGELVEKLDPQNPFTNNLAQAIEVYQFHLYAEKLVAGLLTSPDASVGAGDVLTSDVGASLTSEVGGGIGINMVEAPRGGLYNEIHLDQNDTITYANIITPTVQNLTSIEKSAQALLEQTANLDQKERERLLNMLVRAYDPCITCAVH
jgi:sulfhydrogenase subunit alpha